MHRRGRPQIARTRRVPARRACATTTPRCRARRAIATRDRRRRAPDGTLRSLSRDVFVGGHVPPPSLVDRDRQSYAGGHYRRPWRHHAVVDDAYFGSPPSDIDAVVGWADAQRLTQFGRATAQIPVAP